VFRTSTYAEYAASHGAASAHVECVWVGEVGDDGGYGNRVLPDACVDLIWNGARLFVAGPDTGPVVRHDPPGSFFAGVRFKPGHAPAALGLPASALRDQRVDANDVLGARAARRIEAAIAGRSPGDAARHLEGWVTTTASAQEAFGAIDAIRDSVLSTDVGAIADDVGVTARTLHRRCLESFGYGAKTLQRVLRFRRFLTLAERSPASGLATLAVDAGYADQSHLSRESMRLSGLTPAHLLVSRGVRSVQDVDSRNDACSTGTDGASRR
jgi:methylphosphotriester-DNA--protein-cysteine methyltransferase